MRQACNRNNFVCVPLYETLGEDAIEFILQHSEARLVVVHGRRLGRMAKALEATGGGRVVAVVHFGGGESQADVEVGAGWGSWGAADGFGSCCRGKRRSGRQTTTNTHTQQRTPPPKKQAVMATGVQLLSFAYLETKGRHFPVEPEPPLATDLSTIMYTSGTTGEGGSLVFDSVGGRTTHGW
jgi:long-subunit acyl-CoA synthetase (AMP-forming)